MIDHDLRIRRLMQEASDPEVAVVVLDVVLGYGAHPDPASELGPARRGSALPTRGGRLRLQRGSGAAGGVCCGVERMYCLLGAPSALGELAQWYLCGFSLQIDGLQLF